MTKGNVYSFTDNVGNTKYVPVQKTPYGGYETSSDAAYGIPSISHLLSGGWRLTGKASIYYWYVRALKEERSRHYEAEFVLPLDFLVK